MRVHPLADSSSAERTFAVVFRDGDEAVAGLEKVAAERRLSAARLTAIGAFRRATVAFFDLETKEYLPIEVDEQVEVLSLVGNVSLAGDEHKVHVHVVLGRRDGSTVGGHLLSAVVRPTLEVMLVESPGHLRRHPDEATGLPLLEG
ncbi:MAG TPA: PPC domain-containing DNA-binding protein [Thermoanaerobaculia bacterium]|nr:PPC domain-containing DNA-binding protein [Thermoanaerobaculia bacterium]